MRRWPGDAARPALALHCMMGSGNSWGSIADLLDGRVEMHTADLPGHGKSPGWAPGGGRFADVAMADLRERLVALTAASADGRVDLIGHSFGAILALRLAVETPDRVRSLSLIEPVMFAALPPEARDPDGLLGNLERMEAEGDRTGSTAAFLCYWDGPDLTALPASARDQMIRQMAGVLDTMADLYEDCGGILRPGGLEALSAPVMLISGARSAPVIPAIAEALAQRLPDVGRASVPDARHMAPLTHPRQVAGLIAVNLDRA